jgi:HSP20 family protein
MEPHAPISGRWSASVNNDNFSIGDTQMNLVRWDPFNEIDTIFNRMLPARFYRRPRLAPSENGEETIEWSPTANISETDKEYLIRAELPAVKKEDVKVTVEGNRISIEGERRQHKEDQDEKSIRVESFYGTFTRSFQLPDDVIVDKIRCEEKDGVLTVHLPKSETAKQKPKQIKVE